MSRHALTLAFAGLSLLTALIFFISSLGLPEAAYQLPRILVYLIAALSAAMVWESFLIKRKEPPEESSVPADRVKKSAVTKELAIFILFVAVYVLALRPVGYFIMTPLFILASYRRLKSTRTRYAVLTAFGFTIFVYLLFVRFLHLPVPMGILSGIL